ncbi:MAG TPA: non-ribosomal peptide synthetase, partial [Terriglobales bacterium]|nr:non-ribosomal peptide synthetase [Terriglobales bacterium]
WNRNGSDYGREQTVQALFEEQVARSPEAEAVVYGEEKISYGELNRRANQLARYLRAQGVGRGTLVGICLERGVDLMVGLLGIVKAGGAYVPLDGEYPEERLRFMLQDTEAPVLVTREAVGNRLAMENCAVVCVDRDGAMIAGESGENPAIVTVASDLIYVMYTSGSTGQPKGVCIGQRGVMRLVRQTDYVNLGPGDRIAQASNVSFDAATFEIWGALLNGATLVGVGKNVMLSPRELQRELEREKITSLFLTTALFNQLVAENPDVFGSLREVLFGGEAVDPRRVREVLKGRKPQRLLHVYGPTEVTTFTTWYEVEEVAEEATTVAIGRGIANTQVYVLDEHGQAAPVGVAGEIYAGGDGLAQGYWKRAELTKERFVEHPFRAGERLYRTGDMGRWREDGVIEFLGRKDQQVKVRGYRIELGEIEAALLTHEGVREAIVLVQEDVPGDRRLVGYVSGDGEQEPDPAKVRDHLRQKLPDYMVPAVIMALKEMPLTSNGKLDRNALPKPRQERMEAGDTFTEPGTATEQILVQIWSEVLGAEKVGIHDNFFELGGDSILSIQIISRALRAGLQITAKQLFQNQTIHELAAVADVSSTSKSSDAAPQDHAVNEQKPLPEQGELAASDFQAAKMSRKDFESLLAKIGQPTGSLSK